MDAKYRKVFDKALVRLQCGELKDFVESTSEALEHTETRLADYVEQTAQAMEDEGERYAFEDAMGEKGRKLAQDHPQRVFEACFLGAFFYLEDRMCGIARSEWTSRGAALEISELKRQGIEGAKLVLTKVCGYKLPNTSEWQQVHEYKRIRDCIVHRRRKIGNDQQLSKYVDAHGLRSPRLPKNSIELNHEFCIEVIDVISRYLQELIDILKE